MDLTIVAIYIPCILSLFFVVNALITFSETRFGRKLRISF